MARIQYTDIKFLKEEDLLFLQKHGFPKDFHSYKHTKYLYVFPLVKNSRISACFSVGVANKFEDIEEYVEYVLKQEKECLEFTKETGMECYPKYASTPYKRGYRLGDTVWIFKNPDME